MFPIEKKFLPLPIPVKKYKEVRNLIKLQREHIDNGCTLETP